VTVGVLIGGAFLVVLASATRLWRTVDEEERPSVVAVRIPVGVSVVSDDVACGSGGCSTEIVVTPPQGMTVAELTDQVGIRTTYCSFRWVEFRQVCWWVYSVTENSMTITAWYGTKLGW
jgi:hypothetical protein